MAGYQIHNDNVDKYSDIPDNPLYLSNKDLKPNHHLVLPSFHNEGRFWNIFYLLLFYRFSCIIS